MRMIGFWHGWSPMQPPGKRKGRTWHKTKKRRGEKSEVQKCSLYFYVSGEIGTLKYSDIYTPKTEENMIISRR